MVVQSSEQLLSNIKHMTIPNETSIVTAEIENLYPSICHTHFLEQLQLQLEIWCRNKAYTDWLLALCRLLLRNQFVFWGEAYWNVVQGFGTGLSSGVMFANIYLAGMDTVASQSLAGALVWWFRFVDDAT